MMAHAGNERGVARGGRRGRKGRDILVVVWLEGGKVGYLLTISG